MLPAICFHNLEVGCTRMARSVFKALRQRELDYKTAQNYKTKTCELQSEINEIESKFAKSGYNRDTSDQQAPTDVQEQWLSKLPPLFAKLRQLQGVLPQFACVLCWLFRGTCIHYSSVSKEYRQNVERLFRLCRLRIFISTSTLAVGIINMPSKQVSSLTTLLFWMACSSSRRQA